MQTGSIWAERAIAATPSSAYSAANAGVHAMVRNLAVELLVPTFASTRWRPR